MQIPLSSALNKKQIELLKKLGFNTDSIKFKDQCWVISLPDEKTSHLRAVKSQTNSK